MKPAAFRPIVLMPTYNNAGTLERVIADVAALKLPMLIVNDGSTDGTREIIERLATGPPIIALHHDRNRGKAEALRTGFREALAAGYTHAASIDTDGQHDPSDLPTLLALVRADPDAMLLGVRDTATADYPSKNIVARRLSNFAILLQTGVGINDSQCGLRVYPLALMSRLRAKSHRFGFEAEVICRAAWSGCRFIEAPVRCTYTPEGGRVTHYVPGRDSTRAVLMHFALLLRSFVPLPHPKWP